MLTTTAGAMPARLRDRGGHARVGGTDNRTETGSSEGSVSDDEDVDFVYLQATFTF